MVIWGDEVFHVSLTRSSHPFPSPCSPPPVMMLRVRVVTPSVLRLPMHCLRVAVDGEVRRTARGPSAVLVAAVVPRSSPSLPRSSPLLPFGCPAWVVSSGSVVTR